MINLTYTKILEGFETIKALLSFAYLLLLFGKVSQVWCWCFCLEIKSQVCLNVCMDVTLACKMIFQFANQVHMDIWIYVWTLFTRVKPAFQLLNQIHMDVWISAWTSLWHIRWYLSLQIRFTWMVEYRFRRHLRV